MHQFSTTSGKELWYDMSTNRISLRESIVPLKPCSVVHFNPPTKVSVNNISMFTIEMTQQCNLRCTYCCYSGDYRDRRVHNSKEISYDTLDKTIDFIVSHTDTSSSEITICFYGGEALLAQKKIQYFINKLQNIVGDRVSYTLSTNGLLLTEKVVDWICGFDKFLLNVTIDGNEVMHDAHRLTKLGKGSFNAIISNLNAFKNRYPEQYEHRVRFLSTAYTLEDISKLSCVWNSIDVLRGKIPVHISLIIPNFKDYSRIYDTKESKDLFYARAFEDYKKDEDSIQALYLKKLLAIVEERAIAPLPTELEIITCYQDLFSCYINAHGDLYACEKFCDEFSIGNVSSGFDLKKMMHIAKRFTDRKNKHCSSCWAQRFCRMCLTGLNHTDDEIEKMCDMERDTIELALKYFCAKKDWELLKV